MTSACMHVVKCGASRPHAADVPRFCCSVEDVQRTRRAGRHRARRCTQVVGEGRAEKLWQDTLSIVSAMPCRACPAAVPVLQSSVISLTAYRPLIGRNTQNTTVAIRLAPIARLRWSNWSIVEFFAANSCPRVAPREPAPECGQDLCIQRSDGTFAPVLGPARACRTARRPQAPTRRCLLSRRKGESDSSDSEGGARGCAPGFGRGGACLSSGWHAPQAAMQCQA